VHVTDRLGSSPKQSVKQSLLLAHPTPPCRLLARLDELHAVPLVEVAEGGPIGRAQPAAVRPVPQSSAQSRRARTAVGSAPARCRYFRRCAGSRGAAI
jgi:hypothetical protein